MASNALSDAQNDERSAKPRAFSEQSSAILQAIAKGHSYDQILTSGTASCYPDIFGAASEALALIAESESKTSYAERVAEIHRKHARAYEKWTPDEDAKLMELHRCGMSNGEIATTLQRQTSAIRSRLEKHNLTGLDGVPDC